MKKLNYAIIGTNWLCKAYSHAIREAGENFYAVCSRDLERAEDFADGRAKAFDSIEMMLKDPEIDVVYNCTPNIHHAAVSISCLKAGKHVFCEKPVTTTPEEFKEVCAIADEEGKLFAEAIMNFFSPAIPVLKKELNDSGNIISARLDFSQRSGKLEDARKGKLASTFDKSAGGGVLMDLGVYPLHLAVNLFGMPRSLHASARWFGEVDITDHIILGYDSFDLGITVSKLGQGYIGSEIICDNATFTLKNISMISGVEKINLKREVTELDCGFDGINNVTNSSEVFIPAAARLIRGFSKMVRNNGGASYDQLRKESYLVQTLIKEVKHQIGY